MNKQNIKQQLRKSSLALALVAGLGVGVLCALPKAQASQPAPVSGTFTLCGHNIWDSLHIAGRNLTIDAYQNQIFYGPLAGTLYITPENPEHDVVRLAEDGVTLLRVYFHGSGNLRGFSSWKNCEHRGGHELHSPNCSRRYRIWNLDI